MGGRCRGVPTIGAPFHAYIYDRIRWWYFFHYISEAKALALQEYVCRWATETSPSPYVPCVMHDCTICVRPKRVRGFVETRDIYYDGATDSCASESDDDTSPLGAYELHRRWIRRRVPKPSLLHSQLSGEDSQPSTDDTPEHSLASEQVGVLQEESDNPAIASEVSETGSSAVSSLESSVGSL